MYIYSSPIFYIRCRSSRTWTRNRISWANLFFCFTYILNWSPLNEPNWNLTFLQCRVHIIKVYIDNGLSSIVRSVPIAPWISDFFRNHLNMFNLSDNTLAYIVFTIHAIPINFIVPFDISIFTVKVRNIPDFCCDCCYLFVCSIYLRQRKYPIKNWIRRFDKN